jgi:hypothetical protein
VRHGKATGQDYAILCTRILSPTGNVFADPKWSNALLITARNLVRCAHNKNALLALARSLNIQPLVFTAIDTFRIGEEPS